MRVERVRATSFRCYEELELEPAPGVTAIVGANGSGKTSLLEAVHFGLLGWSPRTSDERRVVAFGHDVARVEVDAVVGERAVQAAIGFQPGQPKRISLDGAPQRSLEPLARTFAALVFTPDRLAVVKGAPAIRRAYFDRALERLWPRYGAVVAEYARLLSQRNHLLRRIRAQVTPRDALEPWDGQLVRAGAEICAARARLAERISAPFAAHHALLGGEAAAEASIAYRPSGPTEAGELLEALAARRDRDVERAQTGVGPHLDDFAFREGEHDVRAFGSQGEQRTALLALLLAEADVIAETRELRPVLLLDDVAGELDADRRARLLAAVDERGQALVTTTDASLIGGAAELVLEAGGGRVRSA